MGNELARSELVRKARANAHRVADRLRQYEDDLARRAPGDAQGGEALRQAAESAERLAELLEHSSGGRPDAPDEPMS
jgi:hypothetical protein